MSVKTSRKHRHLIQFNQRRLLAQNAGGSSAREGGMEEQGIHSLLLRRPGGPGSAGSASEEMLIAWGEGSSPRLWEQLPIPAQRTRPGVGRAELGLCTGLCWGQPETCREGGMSKYPFMPE